MSEPSFAHDRPSLLRHKGCWLTFATVIPLLIGMAWVVEDWAGRRYLEKTKARLVAEGLEIDPAKVLPGPVPDEENFCATPVLVEIGKGEFSTQGPLGRLWEEIGKWRPYSLAKGHAGSESQYMLPSPANAVRTDWTAIYEAIHARKGVFASDPSRGQPVSQLAEEIEARLGAVFAELESVVDRRHALFLPLAKEQWERRNMSDLDFWLPLWLLDAHRLAGAVYWRGHLALAEGQPSKALASWKILFRLAEAADNHGWQGSSLHEHVSVLFWAAAFERGWGAAEWQEVVARLLDYDRRAALRKVMAGHVMRIMRNMEIVRRRPAQYFVSHYYEGMESYFKKFMVYKWLPNGLYDFNEAHALAYSYRLYASLFHENPREWQETSADVMESVRNSKWKLHRVESARTVWAVENTLRLRTAHLLMFKVAGLVATLEMHALETNDYPETLDALVPNFLAEIPLDLDGRPLRYARDPKNGRYKVWSLGLNGTDDGGAIVPDDPRTPQPWGGKQGDWVWEYPAAPAATAAPDENK